MKKINICGIEYEIIETEQNFIGNAFHFGEIDNRTCEIKINKEISNKIKKMVLCHEILYGMLDQIGYDELSNDERFVQCLASAINQSFEPKIQESEET